MTLPECATAYGCAVCADDREACPEWQERNPSPYAATDNGYVLTLTRRDRRGGLIRSLTWFESEAQARRMLRALNPGLAITAGPAIIHESELTGRDAAEIARYRRNRETICSYTVPEA